MRELNSGLFGRLEDPREDSYYCNRYYYRSTKKKQIRGGIIELIIQNDRKQHKSTSKKFSHVSYNRKNSFSGKRYYSKNKRRGRR